VQKSANMRRETKDIGPGLVVLFLAVMFFGMLFWSVRIAQAWDTKVGKMIATIDVLMEKAYGIAVPQEQ
jgi:hypothetical protein